MKTKIIAAFIIITAFSSCTKCVTCIAYYPDGSVSGSTQSVKVCNKTEIDAYETGTNYTDPQGNPVTFKCK